MGSPNSGFSGGLSAARVAFKCLTMPNAPVNEGCFRPLKLISPEGTMVNAKPPAAIGLWSIALPTVIDTILLALAPALPDKIPAAHKGEMGGCSFYGYREDNGKRFLLMNIFGGGWGGRPHEDGENASVSICQGDVRNTPIELQEIHYPFLVDYHRLRPDSGGPGRHRGGLGVETVIITGAWTNMSIEHTARTGADKGYFVVVPEDCCSTMNADWHRASVEYAMQNVAAVTKTSDVIAALGGT